MTTISSQERKSQTCGRRKILITLLSILKHHSKPVAKARICDMVFSSQLLKRSFFDKSLPPSQWKTVWLALKFTLLLVALIATNWTSIFKNSPMCDRLSHLPREFSWLTFCSLLYGWAPMSLHCTVQFSELSVVGLKWDMTDFCLLSWCEEIIISNVPNTWVPY